MPKTSHRGPLPPATEQERAFELELRRDVGNLARGIGERNLQRPKGLAEAADWIEQAFASAGYEPRRQSYEVGAVRCDNLEAELAGGPEIVVIGAHYDTVSGTAGADDNASGVAATLALARRFAGARPRCTLRFVAFANEEPPYFMTDDMGSVRYAKRSRERGEKIVGMLSLESLGYYSDREHSQSYPPPIGMFFPSTANFIAFVSNLGSRRLLREVVGSFRSHTAFPSEGAALPSFVPGVGWSDHWAFWQAGYPAVMVTDTAPFRYHAYHTEVDTPEKLDYERLARVVAGLERVVRQLVE